MGAKAAITREDLQRMYVADGKTSREIAGIVGCSFRTILRKLHEYGLDVRNPGNQRIDKLQDADWLRSEYASGKSSTVIASEIGTTASLVVQYLKRHGIPTRSRGGNNGRVFDASVRMRMSEAKRGRYTGDSNPNWKGGLVSENARLRTSYQSKQWSLAVRTRDGNACVECGKTGRLHAHHIKSWIKHPELRFDVANGVTLCPICHQKAHGFKFPDWVVNDETPRAPDTTKVMR